MLFRFTRLLNLKKQGDNHQEYDIMEGDKKQKGWNHSPEQMSKLGKIGGKKGGKWKVSKSGKTRSEICRGKRITLIPPSISKV